jgi:hypothetical protein
MLRIKPNLWIVRTVSCDDHYLDWGYSDLVVDYIT